MKGKSCKQLPDYKKENMMKMEEMKGNEGVKKCSECGKIKPVTEFPHNKNAKDGLVSKCKECQYEATRIWRKANPEKVRAYDKKK
jgi:NAD-dependent SIR2 family protein deacetylase